MHVYGMTVDKGFSFRQDLKASIQGKRNNRQAEIHGNLKSAALETSHFAVEGACSFREDNRTDAVHELSLHLLQALHSGFRVTAVYEDMSCRLATCSDERHLAQLGFHEPFEDHGQPSIDEPYIEHRLVVSHEDITLSGLNMLGSIDRNGQKHQPEEGAGPELLDLMNELCVLPVNGTNGENRRENCQYCQ